MKLWMRVYLLVLPLVLIVLLGCGMRMLATVFHEMIEREYARGLSDHAMLTGALATKLALALVCCSMVISPTCGSGGELVCVPSASCTVPVL